MTIWSVFLFFFFSCWLLLYRETGDKLANDETISDETDENIWETTLTRCERCRRGKRMAVLLPGIDGPVIISRSGSGLWSFVFHNVTFWICLHIYLSMNWNIKNCNKRRSYRDCYRRWLHFVWLANCYYSLCYSVELFSSLNYSIFLLFILKKFQFLELVKCWTFLFGVSDGRFCTRLPANSHRRDAERRVRIGNLVEFDGPVRFS